MNNTEKKLDALIDALGFDVEENDVFLVRTDGTDKQHLRTDIKLTERDKPVADDEPVNHEWTVDTNTGCAFDDELTINLAETEAFKNFACTARTTIVSSTILKRELLKILETAGKKPKKGTIAIIEHAIDKAFKNE
jgi:hypothetical protein